MNIKYRYTSNIIDFPKRDYGYKEIEDFLSEINAIITEKKGNCFFSDWIICFYLLFDQNNGIGIYKKGRTYIKEKEKEFTVIIPIPKDKEVSWGVRQSKFGYYNPTDESKYLILPINYDNFSNEKDFIIDCTKRAIIALLKYGITIEGQKIKFEDIDKK
jgi:hypothetical protein